MHVMSRTHKHKYTSCHVHKYGMISAAIHGSGAAYAAPPRFTPGVASYLWYFTPPGCSAHAVAANRLKRVTGPTGCFHIRHKTKIIKHHTKPKIIKHHTITKITPFISNRFR